MLQMMVQWILIHTNILLKIYQKDIIGSLLILHIKVFQLDKLHLILKKIGFGNFLILLKNTFVHMNKDILILLVFSEAVFSQPKAVTFHVLFSMMYLSYANNVYLDMQSLMELVMNQNVLQDNTKNTDNVLTIQSDVKHIQTLLTVPNVNQPIL